MIRIRAQGILTLIATLTACDRASVSGETPYAARFATAQAPYVRPASAPAKVPGDSVKSVRDSFVDPQYTVAQATSGAQVYTSTCARCHAGAQWQGGTFAAVWKDRRLSDFYELVSVTMPQDNPGGLTAQQYVDVTAYVLQLAGFASGDVPLRADSTMLRHARLTIKDSTERQSPPRPSRGS